ncbi:MAG TPA: TonB-dependent receptor plug domain-containing protein, partial [Flavisolibacter sp.]|nr:TonB-dependent receptor plug domain-containing protein [Flavisolibacter sp.]
MKKVRLLLLFGSLCLAQCLLAQNRTVTGTVTDSVGIKLPNVSVQLRNSRIGTKTNEEGIFVIQVPSGNATLVVSNIGFETQQISVGSKNNLRIALLSAQQNLQEVVVTALGITRDRRTLGYNTQVIKTEALVDKGETNLLNALQGKIAGADITGAGGAAGSSTNILLRGVASFTGSQAPLMVVDGVPISNDVDESTVGLYSNQSSNRAADLNLNNIESVNVLAGPAAAALYGSRAKNGAIMITTKKGKAGASGVEVTYNTTTQFQAGFLRVPETQSQYGMGWSG